MDEMGQISVIREALERKLAGYFGSSYDTATEKQMYKATILCVRDILTQKRSAFKEQVKQQRAKRVYYLCMEFLVGPSLKNNLKNLGLEDVFSSVLHEMGFDLEALYRCEPDPGLGNGGLGRLAACYMDSLTTLDYPATGFCILYEYGLFKQRIFDGNQVELPDDWLKDGDGWLVPRTDKTFSVHFGGHLEEKWENGNLNVSLIGGEEVLAVPYDMMISGRDGEAVSNLRLWRAKSAENINMNLFSQGQYMKAMKDATNAELISKVLYPSDAHEEGKLLRLSQQYFLVSASLQNVLDDHLRVYGSLDSFADKVALHINDTHPALIVPELMRILMDVYSFSWEAAWKVVTRVVSYTNHTVMPEALECWSIDLFRVKLPRICQITEEINRRFCADLWNLYPGDWDRISRMAIVAYDQVRMANLSVAASHTVNGVSKLHSDILCKTVFRDHYKMTPQKFTNVTNGIAHRRWLCGANPGLTSLLDECIGSDFYKDPASLSEFRRFENDAGVLERLDAIKKQNKERFAASLFEKTGERLDTSTIFDVQVKRIHEYKRQTLNALKIIAYYNELRDNPNAEIAPCTFLFGGKAASGYSLAKSIIRLLWSLGEEIKATPRIRDRMRLVYLEDYNVSMAELLMPASDISEQISLAGKEASGTGCMKFMINGALTLGTLDGANVEMQQAVGKENIYIFGLRADEVEELWRNGYDASSYYRKNPRLEQIMESLRCGFAGNKFPELVNYFLFSYGVADPYLCFADFEPYMTASAQIRHDFGKRDLWLRKELINISAAGHFASDRSIREYAEKIWHLNPVRKNV